MQIIKMMIATVLFVSAPSILSENQWSNISDEELYYLVNDANETYIYCDKYRSKMADIIAQISQFEQDQNSPIWKLNQHINEGFSIGREDAVIEALVHAEQVLGNASKALNSDLVDQLSSTLDSVIDAVTNGQLVVDLSSLLASVTRNISDDQEDVFRDSAIIKIREKLYAMNSAKFFKNVEFKDDVKFIDDVKFKDDVNIEGTLTVAELVVQQCIADLCVDELSASAADIGCDLTVGCNINMQPTTGPGIGNIIKDGSPFMSSFGSNNTFLGANSGNFSMTGVNNTAEGAFALTSNTSGTFNTATGVSALASNTSGSVNTVDGGLAMLTNSTGSANVALGFVAMVSNQIGSANTAVGLAALAGNIDGSANTAVGIGALSNNTSGSTNVAIGADALNQSTGTNNIALGTNAGTLLTSGDDNIYIGSQGAASETGSIRIGTASTHIEAFVQGIFGSAVGLGGLPVEVDATGKLGTVVSSAEFKENIANIGMDSEKIYDLNPVTFSYKKDLNKDIHYGLIAQEVAEVFPSLVVHDTEGKPFAVRYQVLPILLLNEVQKQHANINALAQRVASLEAQIAA